MSRENFDIIVIGAGMSGLSIGAELAADAHVLVLEAEEAPGYHASGRSVAFWSETYGGPAVQPLTTASGPMLGHPDPDFSEDSFLSPRGCCHIGRHGDDRLASDFLSTFADSGVKLERMDRGGMTHILPDLLPEWTVGIAEPTCRDIDAAALLAAYRRKLLQHGGQLRCGEPLATAKRDGAGWLVETRGGIYSCAIFVNAAGAWVDEVAAICGAAPIGIMPLRRTVAQVRIAQDVPASLALIVDLAQQFYFKSVGERRLWLTPHDEVPQSPGDAAPEELAVAVAIDRMQQALAWDVVAVERKWAGLRSFAPDRIPVYGVDPAMPGFFWFAGQGGFGIQTAPAAALLGASLVTGNAPDARVAHIDAMAYAPSRFSRPDQEERYRP